MKNLFFITIMSFVSLNIQSQVFDKKAVCDELKMYKKSPESYYNMKMEQKTKLEDLEKRVKSNKEVVADLTNELNEKNNALEELKREYEKLKENLNTTTDRTINNNLNQNSGASTINSPYRVQIGRFNHYSINHYLTTPKSIVSSNDGVSNVYEIAGFNNANDAYNMSQELRRLGIAGAFVTKYNNGTRDRNYNYLNENPYSIIKNENHSTKAASAASTPPSYNQQTTPQVNFEMNNSNTSRTYTIPSHNEAVAPTSPANTTKKSGNLNIEDYNDSVSTPTNEVKKSSKIMRIEE